MNINARPNSVGVIGAGIVGLSVALELQRQGYQVTVIDRDLPMAGCSSGNAGYVSEANIFPPAAPDMLLQLPKLLLANDGPLVIKPAYLPKMVPWGYRALGAVREATRTSITAKLASMTVQAYTALEELAGYAGASHLLSRDGGLLAFKSQLAFDKKCELLPIWEQHGIEVRQLSAEDIQSLEPALANDIVGGLHFLNSGRCSNPQQLGTLYAEYLAKNGATFHQDKVQQISPRSSGDVMVRCETSSAVFQKIVVCAGYWSGHLLKPFVGNVPLVSERGYHLMLPKPRIELKRPVVFGEPHFAATPMNDGIRLAGTAEFASAEEDPNLDRAAMLLRLARKYLKQLNGDEGQPWMGVRPSLPDGLPAVGQLRAHPSIHYAFGHAHNGLTLSAITAAYVAAQITGKANATDTAALDLGRFN